MRVANSLIAFLRQEGCIAMLLMQLVILLILNNLKRSHSQRNRFNLSF